jgi:hypothetical protein
MSNRFPTKRAGHVLMAAAAAALVVAPVVGQDEPVVPQTSDVGQPDDTISVSPTQLLSALRSSGSSRSSADSFTPFSQATDGLKLVQAAEGERGLFNLYTVADQDARDPTKLLAAIPRGLIGQDLLLATSVASGPLAGYQWNDYLVRFERRGRNLVLSVPNLANRARGPIKESVDRTYTDTILVALPIVSQGSGGETIVDMTPLTMGSAVAVPGAGRLDRGLSKHSKLKVFPDNVLIESEQVRGTGTTGISYSFRKLPSLSNPRDRYFPRNSDERIGYFLTASQNWAKSHDAKDTVDRYINRWRVEKLDPRLEMSPPKEPIVFYIEDTVPVQWRRYVRDGIDEWNKAFEKIGIVDAIEIRQQTETAYADIDPEDARYNFIRWIVTGRGFAMGPSRVDPRTGQILDADIIFDDAMLRYFSSELDLIGPKALARDLGPDMVKFWQDNPQFRPMGVSAAEVQQAADEYDAKFGLFSHLGSNMATDGNPNANHEARQLLGSLGDHAGHDHAVASKISPAIGQCDFATGARRQLAMAYLMNAVGALPPMPKSVPTTQPADEEITDEELTEVTETDNVVAEESVDEAEPVQSQKLPERFLGLVLKEVVAHEVGHTLGLRHNFKASSWLSLDEIKQRRDDADQATVSSVMDYNPVLLFAGDDLSDVETVVTPVLGPYDMWAIEYGYTIVDRRREAEKLAKIAGRAGEKALAYSTDEDTRGAISPDPFSNRYDMGDDPIAWAQSRVDLANELMSTIEQWGKTKGEPNDYLRRAFLNVFAEKVGGMSYVARMVGGQTFSRARFDDAIDGGDAPGLTPLPAADQREALEYLKSTLFADGFFDLDAELLNKIVPSRHPGVGSFPGGQIDFPIHRTVLGAQNRALASLLNPQVIQRVYDAELKASGDDVFTAAELLRGVTEAVWQEIDGEEIDSLRRNLQLQHVEYLIAMVESEPGRLMSADVQNTARFELRRLGKLADQASTKTDDLATEAHLAETAAKIDRVLTAPRTNATAAAGNQTVIIMGRE